MKLKDTVCSKDLNRNGFYFFLKSSGHEFLGEKKKKRKVGFGTSATIDAVL